MPAKQTHQSRLRRASSPTGEPIWILQQIFILSKNKYSILQTDKNSRTAGAILGFLFFFEQLCEFIHKRIDILELPVDGSKADIGDFVDALELLHRELADIDGSHLAVE